MSFLLQKKTFKAYTNAAKQQNKKTTAVYIDSLDKKPTYFTLQILDQVKLLGELNATYNKEVRTFLQNTSNNKIITDISLFLESKEKNTIKQAEEIYLVNNKPQKYSLELVKNGKPFKAIDISNAIPFAFISKSFCWKKQYGKPSIVNLIGQNESCSKNSYRDVTRLNKKTNYFKY